MGLGLDERQRYARQLALPEWGTNGQARLKAARVLVVGAGGLGCPLLTYLAAAGVGTLGIVDGDRVAVSNLHRQVLYTAQDEDQLKAEVAAERLRALNPHVNVEAHPFRLLRENVLALVSSYDLVADGSDNFPTRYLIADACTLTGRPHVYGSVHRFEGQVAVFNAARPDGTRGPQYRDLFPEPPPAGLVPNCAEEGVLGVLPGIIGTLQASEVIKLLTGIGQPLDGQLYHFDAAAFAGRTVRFAANLARPPVTELPNYPEICGTQVLTHEITVSELRQWQREGRRFQLVDVREPAEYAAGHLGGELIPLGQLADEVRRIALDQPVVIHCQSGQRSAQAISQLKAQFGFEHLYQLRGGINAWLNERTPPPRERGRPRLRNASKNK